VGTNFTNGNVAFVELHAVNIVLLVNIHHIAAAKAFEQRH
jgi:hypothetical protein